MVTKNLRKGKKKKKENLETGCTVFNVFEYFLNLLQKEDIYASSDPGSQPNRGGI